MTIQSQNPNQTTNYEDDDLQTPVNRTRRFMFVARVVSFCLVMPVIIMALAGTGWFAAALSAGLVKVYVEALTGLAFAVALAYIGGSVVDYNGGFGFSRNVKEEKNDDNKGPQG